MELINLAGIALLALLIRKLVWCLRRLLPAPADGGDL